MFMSLIGHKHIRKFKVNPIPVSNYFSFLMERLLKNMEKILLIIQLGLLKLVQTYHPKETFASLLICCVIVIPVTIVVKKISKILPIFCAVWVVS